MTWKMKNSSNGWPFKAVISKEFRWKQRTTRKRRAREPEKK
jgi:hypothetical protein